jgi:hypothetical protein
MEIFMSKNSLKNNPTFEERVKSKGGFIIIISDEPCYTCGHRKQMVYPSKSDGRVEVKYKCMFCSVTISTAANRSGV